MKKSLFFLIPTLILSIHLPLYAGSLLTKSEEFSKVATYGMNMATYTAEKKDGKEAAAKLLTFDIIWDILGKGEEFFLNGDPNAFPKFKDDVLKVKLVIDKVAEVSAKLGAGEYSDALIGLIDGGLGVANHPVLNAVWEASKLVIESEKLFKSTKAALQIETLYGIVNQDRRIIGTSSGNAPTLIPIDSDTVTYFFNKYIITDSSTREMVRAYVKTKLGEDFPQTSVSFWEYVSGSSQSIQEEQELAQLQEFENVSRRWIKELLQDLNAQVNKEWAQTRLRQESEKFKLFSEKFGKAYANMDELIAYYTKLKTLEKQKEQFPIKLEELKKRKVQAEANYPQASYEGKMAARGALFQVAEECNVHAANSMVISLYDLEKQFTALQIESLALLSKIDKEMDANKAKIAEEIAAPEKRNSLTLQEYEASILALFKPLLEAYTDEVSTYTPLPTDDIKSLLSANDLEGALTTISKWVTLYDALFAKADLAFDQGLSALESSPKPNIYNAPRIMFLKSEGKAIAQNDILIATQERDTAWKEAQKKTIKAQEALKAISLQRYSENKQHLTAMITYFSNEMKRVADTVYKNRIALGVFGQKLHGTYGKGYNEISDFNPDSIPVQQTIPVASSAKGSLEYLNNNRYTSIGKINDEGVTLNTIAGLLATKKEGIMATATTHNSFIAHLSNIDGELYRLELLKNEWKNFPILDAQTIDLYHDMAAKTPEEAQKRVSLLSIFSIQESNALYAFSGRLNGYKQCIANMTAVMNAIDPKTIKANATRYLNAVNTDLNNRQRDYEYLEELEKQWTRWYAQHKTIELGMKRSKEGDYAIIDTPYPHYALESELKKNEKLENSKNALMKLKVYTFIQNSMPHTKTLLDSLFKLKDFKPAPEDNFILTEHVIWKSTLEKCEKLIGEIDIKKEDAYVSKLKEVAALLPYTISFPPLEEGKKSTNEESYYAKYGKFNEGLTAYSYEHFPLGKKFIELRLRIQELMALKGKLIEQKRLEDSVVESLMLKEVKALHVKVEELAIGETQEYIATYKALSAEHKKHATTLEEAKTKGTPLPDQMLIANLLYKIQERLASHSDAIQSLSAMNQQALIQELYRRFAQEYSAKNLSSLMSLLSDEWASSSDGTTIMDLEVTLGNSFSIFNEVKCTIDSLYISPAGVNTYRVDYTITIQGENYENDIKHVEKSSVSEEVKIINGKPKISQTLSGKYWKNP